MGLLTDADRAAMRADLISVRDDNPVSIVIRRGNTTLAAQTVRIARLAPARRTDQGNVEQSEQRVVVMGAIALDIAKGDRFNAGGNLYEVDFVRPNQTAMVAAEARLIA